MPKPGTDESREDFVDRCIPIVLEDGAAEDRDQAVAMCNSIWKQGKGKSMSTPHDILLQNIRSRAEKKSSFNYGLLTADRYVKTLQDAVGEQACYRHVQRNDRGPWTSFDDVMQKAAKTLTYSTPEMEVKELKAKLPEGIETPKDTLMVFRHVLTTSKKDRDGDILRTGGATVDPKMLLLWQHVHTLPIGKMLAVANHTKDELQLFSCIVDMNDVCHDAAVMIDNDMGRFSHGFRALDFMEIKEGGDGEAPGGYDVKRFEILEESLVSVPANPDSETEEVLLSLVEGGKLTSGMMKDCATVIRDKRSLTVPVEFDVKVTVNGQEVKNANESRDEERGKGIETGPPKETGTIPDEEKEKGTEDAKVKAGETAVASVGRQAWAGDITNSWEWTEQILRQKSKRYLLSMGIPIGENDWATVIATFPKYALIGLDRMGTYTYYQVDWTTTDGIPGFTGEPKEVRIETTTEVKKKMKLLRDAEKKALADDSDSGGEEAAPPKVDDEEEEDEKKKDLICPDCDYKGPGKAGNCPECGAKLAPPKVDDKIMAFFRRVVTVSEKDRNENILRTEKVGRVLNKANEAKLRDTIEDLNEAKQMDGTPRGAKALIGNGVRNIGEVLSSLGLEDGTDKQHDLKEAMAIVLALAGSKELAVLKSLLRAFDEEKESGKVAKQFADLRQATNIPR